MPLESTDTPISQSPASQSHEYKYWLKVVPIILLLVPVTLAFATGFVAGHLVRAFQNGWRKAGEYLDDME